MYGKTAWAMTTVITILLLFSLLYIGPSATVWNQNDPSFRVRKLLNTQNGRENSDTKTIILWNSMFEDEWFSFGDSGHFDSCPKYKNCLMTRNRTLVEVDKFAAVIFHGNQVRHVDVPGKRDPRQLYIFANLESPQNRPLPERQFERVFNLTMTYRLDSDIPWPYFLVRNIDTGEVLAPLANTSWMEPSYDPMRWYTEFKFEEKNKMAAWLVSNCRTEGKRELFVKELEKHMKVDKIGGCNKPVIPECQGHSTATFCFDTIIEPNYFFYLAFENSFCQEYVTEKFFNALSRDLIPVVYGGANYSIFAPPHSYIDALDFDSPKALADFLIELSQDREEYLKYFWWKRFYTVGSANQWTLCKLCERLNDESKPPKTYSPLSDWYKNNRCPIQRYLAGHKYVTKELRDRSNAVKKKPQRS